MSATIRSAKEALGHRRALARCEQLARIAAAPTAQQLDFTLAQETPMTRLELTKLDTAKLRADEADDLVANRLAHALDLMVAPLDDDHLEPGVRWTFADHRHVRWSG